MHNNICDMISFPRGKMFFGFPFFSASLSLPRYKLGAGNFVLIWGRALAYLFVPGGRRGVRRLLPDGRFPPALSHLETDDAGGPRLPANEAGPISGLKASGP